MAQAGRSSGRACYIIAAIDNNHNGDLDLARQLIDAARHAGADAVKFQKRTVELAAVRQVLDRRVVGYPNLGRTYREMLERLEFSVEQLITLRDYAGADLDFIVAPYDIPALQALNDVNLSAIQLDAPSVVHIPLLETLCECKIPIFACTDGCSIDEIRMLVNTLEDNDLTLLHGVHGGHFDVMLAGLRFLSWLHRFGRRVGYSDNESDLRMASIAVILGAEAMEKRLTLSRSMEGPHHSTSLTPDEFSHLVQTVRLTEQELNGKVPEYRDLSEMDLLQSERPSLVAGCRIPKGSTITREMLAVKAPKGGLTPKFIDYVLGKHALYDIEEDDFITFGVISI